MKNTVSDKITLARELKISYCSYKCHIITVANNPLG